MSKITDIRQGIADALVSGMGGVPYVYRAPEHVVNSPAIIVQVAEPRAAEFNTSNRMGDEWYFRVWIMVSMSADESMAYDELDELIYGDNGARQVLHHADPLPNGSVMIPTGVRQYGLPGRFNSQDWISAQVMVTVHTQG